MLTSLLLFFTTGITFGLIGAGGSMLSVPILIYILGFNAETAMSYSFYIVGLSALFGFIGYSKKGLVNFKDAITFAIPSIAGVGFSRYIIVPSIPNTVWSINKDSILIVLFAILMLASAVSMLRKNNGITSTSGKNVIKTIFAGLCVGLIVGILGAGGGFLIIAALYNFLKIDIKKSIGTSLLIITLNCLVAVFLDLLQNTHIKLLILTPIMLSSISGVVIGVIFGFKANNTVMKKSFAIFTITLSTFMLFKELFNI